MKVFHMIFGLTLTAVAGKVTCAENTQNSGTYSGNQEPKYSVSGHVAELDPSQLNSYLASASLPPSSSPSQLLSSSLSGSENDYTSNIDVTALAASSFSGYGQDSDPNADQIQMVECVLPHYFLCSNGNCLPEALFCDGENDCGDGSDEDHKVCGSISCNATTEFKCGGGRCIPNEGRCDRNFQCRDHSDEAECEYDPCPANKFACARNSQCLEMSEVCDGKIDCKDGLASDELHPDPCPSNVTCPAFAFKCTNTNICASPNWLCDGENDCGDGSDELHDNCVNFQCPEGWFRCGDHRCIPISQVCNGVIDCKDGLASDERHPEPCPRNVTCPDDFFSCDETNICAHPHWLCDGADDCGDKSDENIERCAAVPCPEDWFRCKSQRCIPPNWRCDGAADCPTGEDEDKCESHYETVHYSTDSPKSGQKSVKNLEHKSSQSPAHHHSHNQNSTQINDSLSTNNNVETGVSSSKFRHGKTIKSDQTSSAVVAANKAPALGSLAALFERAKSDS